jgi:hypothetical protein
VVHRGQLIEMAELGIGYFLTDNISGRNNKKRDEYYALHQ